MIETYRELGLAPTRLLAVGRGCRNDVWLQATSDLSGLDQLLCESATGPSFGDALLAAMATGTAELDDIAK